MNIEMTREVSSLHTHDKVPDWEEFKISSSLSTQCLDDILWEFTYLCVLSTQIAIGKSRRASMRYCTRERGVR